VKEFLRALARPPGGQTRRRHYAPDHCRVPHWEAPRRRRCRCNRRGAATKRMPAHCPSLRVAGAGQTAVVARSSHAAPGIARRWRLASPALRDSKARTYFSTAHNETTDEHR